MSLSDTTTPTKIHASTASRIAITLLVSALLWGCKTTQSAPSAPHQEALGGEPSVTWANWTAAPENKPQPALDGASAFDYWQLRDPTFASEFWSALFPILDSLRAHPDATPEVKTSMDALLAMLEPGDASESAQQTVDVTFLVGSDEEGRYEGVLLRFSKQVEGTSPSLSLLMTRHAGEVSPTEIVVWGSPAFRESQQFSARLTRQGATLIKGQRARDELLRGTQRDDSSSGLIFDILAAALWPQLTQEAYAEPELSRLDEVGETPAGWSPAAGLSVRERALEEILSDTVFPPSFGDDLGPFGAPETD